jgi:predicted flavoprotein YhiN
MKAIQAHAGHGFKQLQDLPGGSLLKGGTTAEYGISGYDYSNESALFSAIGLSGGEVYRISSALSCGYGHYLAGMC